MSSILIGYVIGDNKSGIDTYLLNVSAILRNAGHEIDFLTNEKTEFMSNICKERGFGLIEIPSLKNIPSQLKEMKAIFNNKHYDVAYFNISEAFNSIGAIVAKQCKVSKVIIHSHSTSVGGSAEIKKAIRKALHFLFKKLVIKNVGTDFFACSQLAAEWMFDKSILEKKNYVIVDNAVEVERFAFNPVIREKKREDIGLDNKYIIGHVSGFTPTKNVTFLVDVINEAVKKDKDAHLLLVGEGDETQKVKDKVAVLGLENHVTFLGRRADVNELLQAFDIFVLPSIFEGAPVVAIEAQVSGMMVYLSDTVTREVKLSEKCKYISLNDSPNKWAEIILNDKGYNRDYTDFSQATYCYDTNKLKEKLVKLF